MKKKELKKQVEFLNDCIQDMAREHIEDCLGLHKKLDNWQIVVSKKDERIKRQVQEITLLLRQKSEFNFKYSSLEKISEMQERQLKQQDTAIKRKDEQYEALKKLYKDDLINGRLG